MDVDVRVAPTCLPSACGDVDGGCDVTSREERAAGGKGLLWEAGRVKWV